MTDINSELLGAAISIVSFAAAYATFKLEERHKKKPTMMRIKDLPPAPTKGRGEREKSVQAAEELQRMSDIRVMRRHKMSQRQIAAVMGMAQSNVCRLMKKYNIL